MPKGQKVVDQIPFKKHPSGGKFALISMSLDSLASVRTGARSFFQQSNDQFNVLIGNAGIMATPYGKTTDGFEQQFVVNHLAHLLLFHLLGLEGE